MGKNDEGIWLDDILCSKELGGTEKLWRDIYRVADRRNLLVNFRKYPIAYSPEYEIEIFKKKKDGWFLFIKETGMELEPLLRKIKKLVENYYNDTKEYIVQKPGGGDMV